MPINLEDLFGERKSLELEVESKTGQKFPVKIEYCPIEVSPAVLAKIMSFARLKRALSR